MPDRYDPITAEQAVPILAAILHNALADLHWSKPPPLPLRQLSLYLAKTVAMDATPGIIDACDRVRSAMTKLTWGHDPIDEVGP